MVNPGVSYELRTYKYNALTAAPRRGAELLCGEPAARGDGNCRDGTEGRYSYVHAAQKCFRTAARPAGGSSRNVGCLGVTS